MCIHINQYMQLYCIGFTFWACFFIFENNFVVSQPKCGSESCSPSSWSPCRCRCGRPPLEPSCFGWTTSAETCPCSWSPSGKRTTTRRRWPSFTPDSTCWVSIFLRARSLGFGFRQGFGPTHVLNPKHTGRFVFLTRL